MRLVVKDTIKSDKPEGQCQLQCELGAKYKIHLQLLELDDHQKSKRCYQNSYEKPKKFAAELTKLPAKSFSINPFY